MAEPSALLVAVLQMHFLTDLRSDALFVGNRVVRENGRIMLNSWLLKSCLVFCDIFIFLGNLVVGGLGV